MEWLLTMRLNHPHPWTVPGPTLTKAPRSLSNIAAVSEGPIHGPTTMDRKGCKAERCGWIDKYSLGRGSIVIDD